MWKLLWKNWKIHPYALLVCAMCSRNSTTETDWVCSPCSSWSAAAGFASSPDPGRLFCLDLIFSILQERGQVDGSVIIINTVEKKWLKLQWCVVCLTVSSVFPQISSPSPVWQQPASSPWPQTAQRPLEELEKILFQFSVSFHFPVSSVV